MIFTLARARRPSPVAKSNSRVASISNAAAQITTAAPQAIKVQASRGTDRCGPPWRVFARSTVRMQAALATIVPTAAQSIAKGRTEAANQAPGKTRSCASIRSAMVATAVVNAKK